MKETPSVYCFTDTLGSAEISSVPLVQRPQHYTDRFVFKFFPIVRLTGLAQNVRHAYLSHI